MNPPTQLTQPAGERGASGGTMGEGATRRCWSKPQTNRKMACTNTINVYSCFASEACFGEVFSQSSAQPGGRFQKSVQRWKSNTRVLNFQQIESVRSKFLVEKGSLKVLGLDPAHASKIPLEKRTTDSTPPSCWSGCPAHAQNISG